MKRRRRNYFNGLLLLCPFRRLLMDRRVQLGAIKSVPDSKLGSRLKRDESGGLTVQRSNNF